MQKTASQVEAAEHFGVDPPKFTFSIEKKTKKYENEVDDRPSESNKKNFQENKLNKMNSIQK